ncbi:AraC family transcriptional regulator [bacterium]|nr:AraC family transcriptional regulator [bacterium]
MNNQLLCRLLFTGRAIQSTTRYDWHGLKRRDQPCCIMQYTISGKGLYEDPIGSFSVPTEHAMLLSVPEEHRYRFPGGKIPWEFIWIAFTGECAHKIWNSIREKFGSIVYFPKTSDPIKILYNIHEKYQKHRIFNRYTSSELVYQLLMSVLRFLNEPSVRKSQKMAINNAAGFIAEHYMEPIGVEQIAARFDYSREHFSRIFKKYCGISPFEYLQKNRIQEAIYLLRTGTLSVKEIAKKAGFDSASYFCRVFRKTIRISPAQYRRQKNFIISDI